MYTAGMARFVLIHGAFCGAWCWEPVVGPLEAAGHVVEAFDLPGSGDDVTPAEGVTLDAYVERICAVLAGRPEPAVLVGHSLGGVAITQAAARCPQAVASLVYVTAFVPRDGQTLLDLSGLPEGEAAAKVDLAIAGDPPVAVMPDAAALHAVYNECSEERARWATARRGPQAVAPFVTPVSLEGADLQRIPRAYVTCSEDRRIPYALQRRMIADNGIERVVELHADHSPFLSATDELVAALLAPDLRGGLDDEP
jgi:pimeloyl-ACP methyl ester carboxylesterase